jgi:diaminopimelate epimerase
MQAGGNDFICIDNRAGVYDRLLAAPRLRTRLLVALCAQRFGIGADGVIFAEPAQPLAAPRKLACGEEELPQTADCLAARFFDADGTEELLCGNGVTCFTKWALETGLVATAEIDIQTGAGLVHGKAIGESRYRVCVPAPQDLNLDFTVVAGESLYRSPLYRAAFLRVGVPHLVVEVDDLETVAVPTVGKVLRDHPRFAADGGVNVNFVQVMAEGLIKLRTYEVGVEDETLSCGTGSAAAAIVVCLRHADWALGYRQNELPVEVITRGGETLRIWFTLDAANAISATCLETAAHCVCTGEWLAAVREDTD